MRPTLSKPCEQCGRVFTSYEKNLWGVRWERLRFCGNACAMRHKRAAGMGVSHGLARTPEYRIWTGMIGRCHSPGNTKSAYYGGRGIRVCDEWRNEGGFERFLSHIGPRPSRKHSVDRIDNAKGYEPGNVRWATKVEQQRNMRSNRLVTVGDLTLSIAEWSERRGFGRHVIHNRIARGWTPIEAVVAPLGVRKPRRAA